MVTLCFDYDIVGPWVIEKAGSLTDKGTAIGQMVDGKLNAGVIYENWNGANLFASIRGEGNWANRHFLNIIVDYPFNQIGVKRITATVGDHNLKSINLLQRMGFELECKLAEANPIGKDVLIYRLTRERAKYLIGV